MRQLPLDHGLPVMRIGVIIMTLSGWSAVSSAQQTAAPQCQASGALVRISELPEASGVALSRRSPGRLWAHNDSGDAVLIALDTRGTVTGRVRVSGVKVDDWEAVAVGPCPGGACIYIADIGDNGAERKRVTIYRVTEPSTEGVVAVKDTFHATYPDGAHDAETLLIAPDGSLFIVTKGETDAVGLYRFPRELRPGATHQLERVGTPRASGNASETERITDGTVSPDGTWVALRTRQGFAFHRAADLFAGNWTDAGRVDLKAVGEVQGEGIAIASFIREIDDRSRITFEYRGIYRDVINSVTPSDVRWACQLLSRLSERQWREAFRTAQYDEQHATRYIGKIKQKIAQGLALTAPPAS